MCGRDLLTAEASTVLFTLTWKVNKPNMLCSVCITDAQNLSLKSADLCKAE